jgi:hypothetical protein
MEYNEYNEMAAKRRKKLKSEAFMRLLRLFAAILLPRSVAYAAASSVKAGPGGKAFKRDASPSGRLFPRLRVVREGVE